MTMLAWLLGILVISQGTNSVGAINQDFKMDSLLAASCVFLSLLADFSEGYPAHVVSKNGLDIYVETTNKLSLEELYTKQSCVGHQDCNTTESCIYFRVGNNTDVVDRAKCLGPEDAEIVKHNCDIHPGHGPGAYVGLVVPLVGVVPFVVAIVCLVCRCCGWCCFKESGLNSGGSGDVGTPLTQIEGTVNQQGNVPVSSWSERSVTMQYRTAASPSVEGRSDGSFRSQGSTAPLTREPSNNLPPIRSCPSSPREEVNSNECPEVRTEDEIEERITNQMRQLKSSVLESSMFTTGRRKETQPPDRFQYRSISKMTTAPLHVALPTHLLPSLVQPSTQGSGLQNPEWPIL